MFELTRLFDYADQRNFGEIHIKTDSETGLRAIVAIHSTELGPALGGCRCLEYDSVSEAFYDVLRLARAMSYKAAISQLPLGGGKAVLMKPKKIANREAYFRQFGQFVNRLQGQYITAEDSGTTTTDMAIIAQETTYVASSPEDSPSPHTAYSVLRGMQAAVNHKLQRRSLADIHVALQGAGAVGYQLARFLHEQGAHISVADISPAAVTRCVEEFGAQAVSIDDIHRLDCDVFSPCALGAVINDDTVTEIQAPIVVGSANNQLKRPYHGQRLFERGILYAPDYVTNAGGLIYVAKLYLGMDAHFAHEKIDNLYHILEEIFARSDSEQRPSSEIANTMAEEKLMAAPLKVEER